MQSRCYCSANFWFAGRKLTACLLSLTAPVVRSRLKSLEHCLSIAQRVEQNLLARQMPILGYWLAGETAIR